jgi:hypothetical protein
MHRKLLAICAPLLALGALAILPAVGSAATLTDTVGGVTQKLAVGAKFVGEGTGTTTFSGGLELQCNENVLTGTVHRNSGGIVEMTLEDAWFQGNYFADPHTPCESGGARMVFKTNLTNEGTTVNQHVGSKTHWCIVTEESLDKFELLGRNCTGVGPGEFTIQFEIPSLGYKCGLRRTTPITGSFNTSNTHSEVAELTMNPNLSFVTDAVAGHSVFCPGSTALTNLVFALYTDNNTTPTTGVHPVPINKTAPLYISSP